MEKLLEDAQIKISAVLSNLHGVTGRAIMDGLIAGERDPRTLAGLAKGLARKKTDRLDFLSSTISTTLKTQYDLNGATLKLWTPRDTALGDDGRMPTLVEPAIVVDVWSSTDQRPFPLYPQH